MCPVSRHLMLLTPHKAVTNIMQKRHFCQHSPDPMLTLYPKECTAETVFDQAHQENNSMNYGRST